jgi:hypothetical protein
VRERHRPARVRGDQASDRRTVSRTEVQRHLPPGFGGDLLDRRERDPRPDEQLPRRLVELADLCRPLRLISTSPARGTPPPTTPVSPPWGTMSAPCAQQIRSTSVTCAVSAGRTTAQASPP